MRGAFRHEINEKSVFDLPINRISCKVFTVNKPFDALLDDLRVREEAAPELLCHFTNQLVVCQSLAGLHNTYNGCFDFVLSVCFNLQNLPFLVLIIDSRFVIWIWITNGWQFDLRVNDK